MYNGHLMLICEDAKSQSLFPLIFIKNAVLFKEALKIDATKVGKSLSS